MATPLARAARLKPEVRSGQAISEFQADLSLIEKVSLMLSSRRTYCPPRQARIQCHQQNTSKSPPNIRDVMQLTAELMVVELLGPKDAALVRGLRMFCSPAVRGRTA
ncbi:hypothetical protein BJY00DRAFT_318224 [Aspergillus carlsbadensis]|nr:hypothetical protein BJY00DRAFT_318224 [Aspergillus carlsbadensis]